MPHFRASVNILGETIQDLQALSLAVLEAQVRRVNTHDETKVPFRSHQNSTSLLKIAIQSKNGQWQMNNKLETQFQDLVDLVVAGHAQAGSFRALLVLLKDAPDSQVILDALDQINPDQIDDAALKSQAAELLMLAGGMQHANSWRDLPVAETYANVVSLTPR